MQLYILSYNYYIYICLHVKIGQARRECGWGFVYRGEITKIKKVVKLQIRSKNTSNTVAIYTDI